MKMSKRAGVMAVTAMMAVSGASFAAQSGAGPCTVGPNGPMPAGCTYRTPDDIHKQKLADQAKFEASHKNFLNVIALPGGNLNGEIERFDSTLVLVISGTGDLEGHTSTIELPTRCETHIGPRDVKADFQSFATEMVALEGYVENHPDFDYIKVVAGSANGLPSPGSTTLTRKENGDFLVDSRFYMNYRIEFRGAKGSWLEGVETSEEAVVTVQAFANQ